MPIPETVNHPIGCRRSDIWDLTPSLIFLLLTFMATRRRSSATKTAKSASPKTVKESVKEVVEESVKKAVDNILNEGVISDDMKESLDGVDPWMANKMKQ